MNCAEKVLDQQLSEVTAFAVGLIAPNTTLATFLFEKFIRRLKLMGICDIEQASCHSVFVNEMLLGIGPQHTVLAMFSYSVYL